MSQDSNTNNMPDSPFRLLSLPRELVDQILSIHSTFPQTLRSLSLVSHLVRDLVTPGLFRTVTFSADLGLRDGPYPMKSRRYLRPIGSHPALSSVRNLRICLLEHEFFSNNLDIKKQIQYLTECVKALEGFEIETVELTVLGNYRTLKSNQWAGVFIHGLEESLEQYHYLRAVKIDLSFQSGRDDSFSVTSLLHALRDAPVERISLNIYGPLDIIFSQSGGRQPEDSLLSSPNLKHLALGVMFNQSDLALRSHCLPCYLQTLSFTNQNNLYLDFDFNSLYSLFAASAASLQEIEFDDYEHDMDLSTSIWEPIDFKKLKKLTLRAINQRHCGVIIGLFEKAPIQTIELHLSQESNRFAMLQVLMKKREEELLKCWVMLVNARAGSFSPTAREAEAWAKLRKLGVNVVNSIVETTGAAFLSTFY
ncbi:hypothetical protein BT69DRAFT_1319545 [Atractiella rhizophila]|nr:hypothetical protein BT69DRAFT_1319545 [Atractiella rhizophila]